MNDSFKAPSYSDSKFLSISYSYEIIRETLKNSEVFDFLDPIREDRGYRKFQHQHFSDTLGHE